VKDRKFIHVIIKNIQNFLLNSRKNHFTIFLLFSIVAPLFPAIPQTALIVNLKGINIRPREAIVITEKLRYLLTQTGEYTIYYPQEFGFSSIPLTNMITREGAEIKLKNIDASMLIWGNIKKDWNVYTTTIYMVSKSESGILFDSCQEIMKGELRHVLEYSIDNIVMKIIGEYDKHETKLAVGDDIDNFNSNVPNLAITNDFGQVEIRDIAKDVKVFIDGEYATLGESDIKLSPGIHTVTAKTSVDTRTEQIQIAPNDIMPLSLEVENKRVIKFAMTFEGSMVLGEYDEFVVCHTVGIKIKDKHYVGLSYYDIVPFVFYSETFLGGGFTYTYAFNVKNIFINEYGATAGFWWEDRKHDRYYFGGPKIRLHIGYTSIFLMAEATLLLGTDKPKIAINNGFSFIF